MQQLDRIAEAIDIERIGWEEPLLRFKRIQTSDRYTIVVESRR